MSDEDFRDTVNDLLGGSVHLKGLTLYQLGALLDPATMTEEEKDGYDESYLEEMAAAGPEERSLKLRQAQLLAGAIRHASVTLIDHLFDDLQLLTDAETVTPAVIDQTWVLASLPRRFAHRYGVTFTRKLLVIAADLTGRLAREWREPDCVAGDLLVKCLLDEVDTVVDLYELDVPGDWRSDLEDAMVEDFDYDMLYDRSMDGFEDDEAFMNQFHIVPMSFDRWFQPFHEAYSVPPYVMG